MLPTLGYLLTFSPRTVSRNFLSHIRDVVKTKRTRDREGVFVLEGTKPILELVQSAPQRIVCLIVTPSFLDRQPPERHRLPQPYSPQNQTWSPPC